MVVGAPRAGSGAGRAYVFTHTSEGWRQSAELKPSDAEGRSDMYAGEEFGSSLAISSPECRAKGS
jgi:hypothetical protein